MKRHPPTIAALLPPVLCLLSPVFSQTTQPQKPGTVEGSVINAVTGEPIRKAYVVLRSATRHAGYTETTDSAGHFSFNNVEPGLYLAITEHPGFTSEVAGRHRSIFDPPSVQVAEEQSIKDIVLKLFPLGAISGRVLDDDGDPIPHVEVHVLQYSYHDSGARQLISAQSATTNDLGEYRIFDLAPGRNYVSASHNFNRSLYSSPSDRTRDTRPDDAYVATLYPNAEDSAQGTPVNVTPGSEVAAIDFRLRRTPTYRIRGRIIDAPSGQAAGSATVILEPAKPGWAGWAGPVHSMRATPQGTFEFRWVIPGSYSVMAQSLSEAPSTFACQLVEVSDRSIDGLALTLSALAEVSGSARIDDGPADKLENLYVVLQPTGLQSGSRTSIAKDGSFRFRNFSPDSYLVSLSPPAGTYLKSIRFGGQETPDGVIRVSQGGGNLQLSLATDGGQLDGVVQNPKGEPAGGILVALAPEDSLRLRRDLLKTTDTSPAGQFHFADIAPGNYKLFAWEDVDPGAAQNADFRKPFESQAASVTIRAGSHETVQLKAIPAEAMEINQ